MTAGNVIMNLRGKAPAAAPAAGIAADIRDARLRRFYDYWRGKCGARRFPARGDIDPLDFPYVLGNLMLVDVLHETRRFRVRLHGTNIVSRMYYDMTGKFLDEVPRPEYRSYVLERCRNLVETGEPLVLQNDLMLDGWVSRYEALWLPLSDDGANVDLLICAFIFAETEPAAT